MKKLNQSISAIILVAIIVTVMGCSNEQANKSSSTEINSSFKIVTSFYPMYIFAKNIAKGINGVEVVNMANPQTGCLHDYSLTSNDMKLLEKANVLIINGAGMESFMDKVVKQKPNLKVIEASKGFQLIKNDHHGDEHKNDKEEDHHKNHKEEDHHNNDKGENEHKNEHKELEYNPHVWVSISGAIHEVKTISAELAKVDNKNAEKYKKNSDEYVKKLEELLTKMKSELKNIKNKNIVTFHESFPYFAKEFNLNIVGVIAKEPGQEPTAEEIKTVINVVKQKKVKALFTEEQYSPKVAETISRETGTKVYKINLVVTGSNNPDLDTYEKIMEKNLKVLKEALN